MHKMEDEEPSLKHLEALKLPDFVTCSCHSLRMAERDVREGTPGTFAQSTTTSDVGNAGLHQALGSGARGLALAHTVILI